MLVKYQLVLMALHICSHTLIPRHYVPRQILQARATGQVAATFGTPCAVRERAAHTRDVIIYGTSAAAAAAKPGVRTFHTLSVVSRSIIKD